MDVDRLEDRIRAVPGVIACQLGPDVALVLVAPGTDGARVRTAVAALVADAAATLPVRVLASPAGAPRGARFRRRSGLVLVGSAAALTVGVAAAATLTPLDPGRLLDPGSTDQTASSPDHTRPAPTRGRTRGTSTTTTVESVVHGGLAAEAVGPHDDEVATTEAPADGAEHLTTVGVDATGAATGFEAAAIGTAPFTSRRGHRTGHAVRPASPALAISTAPLDVGIDEAAAPVSEASIVPATTDGSDDGGSPAGPTLAPAPRPMLLSIPLPDPLIAAIRSAPSARVRPLPVPSFSLPSLSPRADDERNGGAGRGAAPGHRHGRALGHR